MNFEGTTYRPPTEADSMLLQVTVGCAHNKCSFCNMYQDVRFRAVGMDQIENDLKEAKKTYPKAERIFLVNGDAFVLPAGSLKRIAEKCISYFPECKTISMYASVNNIKSKSDRELRELKDHRINDLYVGVESGDAAVVKHINKGHTLEDAKKQLRRLTNVGINHVANLMLGVAGKNRGLENARQTAAFLNETHPRLIWAGTLAVFEGTSLYRQIKNRQFFQASELEILAEEKELIRQIQLPNVRFYGTHPTNTVKVSGVLPRDREEMLQTIDNGIQKNGRASLETVFPRMTL